MPSAAVHTAWQRLNLSEKQSFRKCSYWAKFLSGCLFRVRVRAFCSLIKQHDRACLMFFRVIMPADYFPGSDLQSTFFHVFGAFWFILQTCTREQTSHGHVSLTLSCWLADFGGGEGCAKTNLFPVPVTVTAVTGHSGMFLSVCTNYLPLMIKPAEDTMNSSCKSSGWRHCQQHFLVICRVLSFWIYSVPFVQCMWRLQV